MVQSIAIVTASYKEVISFSSDFNSKISVDCQNIVSKTNSFAIEFTFTVPIISMRNHDYTWVSTDKVRIANTLSPKIIKLSNGCKIQANINKGIWEVSPKNDKVLLWKFNPDYSQPITVYSGKKNTKRILSAKDVITFTEQPALLFTKKDAIEVSRSKLPFSAIACFTDHCDYDTLSNLKMQRELFSEIGIKITKGFFLNHFSKRSDNASIEQNKEELAMWKSDGHELCYHSLSQSIKSTEESFSDFKNFQPPFEAISVWIDHGFQPYNFSFYNNNGFSDEAFETILRKSKIQVLWNYIDCGIATDGVINQLNSSHFTLAQYWESIAKFSFKSRLIKLIKVIIFHYDNDENRIRNYIDSISASRNLLKSKNPIEFFNLVVNILPVSLMVLRYLIRWKSIQNKPFKAAQYTPVVFNHQIKNSNFKIFQTIELVDFINGLSKSNIDTLIEESGLFIAHTYFSVDMKHHQGKMFKTANSFDPKVMENFRYLSEKIKEGSLWNPTLSELIEQLQYLEEVIFDIDTDGSIYVKNNLFLSSRAVS